MKFWEGYEPIAPGGITSLYGFIPLDVEVPVLGGLGLARV
jgi:hypothetical protein